MELRVLTKSINHGQKDFLLRKVLEVKKEYWLRNSLVEEEAEERKGVSVSIQDITNAKVEEFYIKESNSTTLPCKRTVMLRTRGTNDNL